MVFIDGSIIIHVSKALHASCAASCIPMAIRMIMLRLALLYLCSIVKLICHQRNAHDWLGMVGCLIYAVAASMRDKGLHIGMTQNIILRRPADNPDVAGLKWVHTHVSCMAALS